MSKKALLVVVGLLLLSLAAPALASEPEAGASGSSAMGSQKAAQFLAAAIVLWLAAFAGAF